MSGLLTKFVVNSKFLLPVLPVFQMSEMLLLNQPVLHDFISFFFFGDGSRSFSAHLMNVVFRR